MQHVADGNDLVAIEQAILAAKAETKKPSLIRVRDGDWLRQPEGGTNKVHVRLWDRRRPRRLRRIWAGLRDKSFYVPDEARANLDTIKLRG